MHARRQRYGRCAQALTPPRSLTTTPNNMRLDSLSCLRLGRQDRIGAETCQKRARSEPHGLTGAPCGAGMQSGSASRVLQLDLGFHHRRNAHAVSAAFNNLRQAPACVHNWFFASLAVAITPCDINVRGRVEIGRSAVACFSLRKTEGASGARKSGGRTFTMPNHQPRRFASRNSTPAGPCSDSLILCRPEQELFGRSCKRKTQERTRNVVRHC